MTSYTLLSLPVVVQKRVLWRLPLCDASALAMACAAVESDSMIRAAQLADVLAADPALAVWAVLSYSLDDARDQLRPLVDSDKLTISTLAHWLSSRFIVLFCERAIEGTVHDRLISLSAEQHGQFAALVAETAGAAYQTIHATSSSDVRTAPEFLSALTMRWSQWLSLSCADPSVADSPLPPWPLAAASLIAGAANIEPTAEARAAADEVWRRWLTEIPAAKNLLPGLLTQLRRLANLESTFQERLQIAKFDALKDLAYGAGHELNNPLANIASRAQTLLVEETNPERRRRLAAINTQAFRAHEMLADMMLFARPPQLAPEPIDLVQLVDDTLSGLSEDAATQQTALHAPTRRDPLIVEADATQLRVALRAVCVNSLEALGQGGNVTIELCVGDAAAGAADKDGGDWVQISISDDGPGIPAEIREQIFNPFFSGREAGRGLGFGLSKCWRIVTLHGGRVSVDSGPGRGATFTLTLPVRRVPSLVTGKN